MVARAFFPTQQGWGLQPTTLAASLAAESARVCDGIARKQQRFLHMPTYAAARHLDAPREDVWALLAEQTRLGDW